MKMPTVTCKPHTVQLDANGLVNISPNDVFDNGDDNCGTVNPVSVAPNSFPCNDLGENLVILTANDGNGNTNTCEATVTVEDNTMPSVTCRPHTVQLAANGTASILPNDVFDNGNDNCGTVNLVSVAPNTFSCNNLEGTPLP